MNESEFDSLADKPDDSAAEAEFQQLAEIIRSFVTPHVRSEKWTFLGGRDDLRIHMAPIEFIAALQIQYDFTVEALAELGLYERVEDELRPPNWLELVDDLYVAIDENNRTITFSDGNDFLFPRPRTALDYALDRMPPESPQPPATLFIVDAPDDVEVMQRLGLQAVRSDSLSAIDGLDVQKLFRGDRQSDFGWRYFLVLVDFDVARLENRRLVAMDNIIRRLADAAEVYGIDPSRRFGVCRPAPSEFQYLERTTAFKDVAQICQVFENWSAAAQNLTVGSWRSHFALETPSFSATSAALTEALQQSRCFRERAVRVALPAYRAAGKEAIMQKFHNAIDRAHDPFDQINIIAAAGYAETFLDNDPLVRAAEAVLLGQDPPAIRELQEESFAPRQRCMVEIRRIRRDRNAKY